MMFGEIRIGRLVCYLVLVLAVIHHVPTYANTEKQDLGVQAPTPQVPAVQSRYRAVRGGLDDRIKALSHALDLDEVQQSKLRKVLESQREQVMKVWSDSSLPAAYRINATQAISDGTADQIRALLSEEQRKKYNPPRRSHEAATGASERSVEDWMEAAKPKQVEVSPNP